MTDEDKVLDEGTPPEGDEKDTETPPPQIEGEENKESTKEDDKQENNVNPDDVDLDNPDEVSQALDKKGIDYNALTDEYMANKKLSEETFKKLEAAGIPREMVENYIKGYEARVEIERNELAEVVGSREKFNELITWCTNNLETDEISSLNAIRDKFQLQTTLKGLKVRMEEKEGINPNYQKGDGDKNTMTGYHSQAEMFEAIKDPKYQKDPAYRADVQKKIAASREAGIDLGIY